MFSTRSPSRTGNDHEVQPRVLPAGDVRGERDRPDADGVAVLEPVVDPRGRVADEPDPDEGPQRQGDVGVVAAGGDDVGARFAGPQLGARRLLERRQPARVVARTAPSSGAP